MPHGIQIRRRLTAIDQLELIPGPTQAAFLYSDAVINGIYSGMGEGKCHQKGTRILMHDGNLKAVEDIRVGDLVMGDDSSPRLVLKLANGWDEMYEIVPNKGEPFTVNGAHMLCVTWTGGSPAKRKYLRKRHRKYLGERHRKYLGERRRDDDVLEIPVDEYNALPKWLQNHLLLSHAAVDFPPQSVTLDPYYLGLWLGDGTACRTDVTTADPEIVDYLYAFAETMDCTIKVFHQGTNKASTYAFCKRQHGRGTPRLSQVFAQLRRYNLLNNKHIPLAYRANSREVRLALLAGLIDSDGSVNRSGYQIIQKSETLAQDIAYVSRSLGFQASVHKTEKGIRSRGFVGTYYRIYINGNCSIIPVKIARKRVPPRQHAKNVLLDGLRSVHPLGYGEYFGFTLDGNHRYLDGDFRVHHNSWAVVVKLLRHAQRNYVERGIEEIEAYVIRDTLENCKRSPIPTYERVLGPLFHLFNQAKEALIYTKPLIHLSFFGIADAGDLTKLQGPEPACIHLEEVCPVDDPEKYSAGVSEDVYNLALARAVRHPEAIPLLMVSGNTGDQDHWFYRRLVEPLDGPVDEDTPLITKRVFKILYGENVHLPEMARQGLIAAYRHDHARFDRFVKGEFVPVYRGKRVAEAFRAERHIASEILVPLVGVPAFRLWDSWGEPRCVMGQQLPNGQMRIIDVVEDHTDIRALVPKVESRMAMPKWVRAKVPEWRDIGDWTMRLHDQSNRGEDAAGVIEDTFASFFEPGPARWNPSIKLCIGQAFRGSTSDGQPLVLITPELRQVQAALNGRWHYPTDRSGNVKANGLPVKDQSSHSCDALANGFAVLQPWHPVLPRNLADARAQRARQRQRAEGYGMPKVSYG